MKAVSKIIFGTIISLGMLGCDGVKMDGVLDVKASFNAQTKQDAVLLSAGSYESSLRFKSKNKAELIVIFDEEGREDLVIPINIPKSTKIPNEGKFKLKGQNSGQDFDVTGEITTQVDNSETFRVREQCTEVLPYTECYGEGENHRCRTYDRTYYGWIQIEYFDRTTTKKLTAQLDDGKGTVATFTGSDIDTDRVVIYRSHCK